ncbi:hypothetical protein BDB01DRAFT_776781 [Pilobolus umbonatus]|nr:hypothetical protein BDB01DRAFT_776781 [Pilobolus umbonatus]
MNNIQLYQHSMSDNGYAAPSLSSSISTLDTTKSFLINQPVYNGYTEEDNNNHTVSRLSKSTNQSLFHSTILSSDLYSVKSQHKQYRWDDSQFALELAEDNLLNEKKQNKHSARRLGKKIVKSFYSNNSTDMADETESTSMKSDHSSHPKPKVIFYKLSLSYKKLKQIIHL